MLLVFRWEDKQELPKFVHVFSHIYSNNVFIAIIYDFVLQSGDETLTYAGIRSLYIFVYLSFCNISSLAISNY
jgi:hypothetical protein